MFNPFFKGDKGDLRNHFQIQKTAIDDECEGVWYRKIKKMPHWTAL